MLPTYRVTAYRGTDIMWWHTCNSLEKATQVMKETIETERDASRTGLSVQIVEIIGTWTA